MDMSNLTFNVIEIGRKISQLRKQKNMTQVELADTLNISFQAVSNWERGESLPDISKLPELARVFDVSIDDILNNGNSSRIIKMVMAGKTDEVLHDESISTGDIIATAPLLKPAQVDELFEGSKMQFTMHELRHLVPFVSREIADDLAQRISDDIGISELRHLAPFLSTELVDELAGKITGDIGISELLHLAPFLSTELVDELAGKITGDIGINELRHLAPFVSRGVLDSFATKLMR